MSEADPELPDDEPEDEEDETGMPRRDPAALKFGRRLSLRVVIPNALTAAALCIGLTAVRFAIEAEWEQAIAAIVLAGVIDGLDGRVARMLHAESRFGAELDSLSDNISFGVTPALVLFLWTLRGFDRFGWVVALALALCCALRLARFNARIDVVDQPHKSAGFLTGVPAPVGAGLALLPLYLWLVSGWDGFREPLAVAIWVGLVAVLLISNVATYSWRSFRLREHIRLEVLAIAGLLGAALITIPFISLTALAICYLVSIPFSIWSYRRVKRRRVETVAAEASRPD